MTDDAPTPAPELKTAKPGWLSGGRAGYLALGLSVIALGFSAAPYLTGGSNVRAYLLEHPEVLQEAQMGSSPESCFTRPMASVRSSFRRCSSSVRRATRASRATLL